MPENSSMIRKAMLPGAVFMSSNSYSSDRESAKKSYIEHMLYYWKRENPNYTKEELEKEINSLDKSYNNCERNTSVIRRCD